MGLPQPGVVEAGRRRGALPRVANETEGDEVLGVGANHVEFLRKGIRNNNGKELQLIIGAQPVQSSKEK